MNTKNIHFYLLKLIPNSKSFLWLIFLFLAFICGTLFGQKVKVNKCDFTFNVKIKKQDSIPLKNKKGKIIKYWTQSEFNYITSYLTIDNSTSNRSRIKSIDEVIVNYGDNFYTKNQIEVLNKTISGLWISNDYLTTDFAEWVFIMNRGSLSESSNPDKKNYFFVYSKPTPKSTKKTLDINNFFEEGNNTTLHKINILECKGKWTKVKISVAKLNMEIVGWMPWYNFCYNILTTCTNDPKTLIENEE